MSERIALVTGGSRGLGKNAVLKLIMFLTDRPHSGLSHLI